MIIIVMIISAAFGVIALKDVGNENANNTLRLLCEVGQKNLDDYFSSVEQSVELISAYVESDLDGIDDQHLSRHVERVRDIFTNYTFPNNSVLTYYYRIDPNISDDVDGFWYVRRENGRFIEHETTDITQYDVEDTPKLVWFTVPKHDGKAVWLPPYITENLGARVLSYNVPVYYKDSFVGVIGIEIDYTAIAEQVDNIVLYENGYAFINDTQGRIIYHPRMDVTAMESQPVLPDGLLSSDSVVTYNYEGVDKQGIWLPLENNMHLNVSVPVDEINIGWRNWVSQLLVLFLMILSGFIALTLYASGMITKPLSDLTEAARQVDKGNYDYMIEYNGNDEIGVLTRTFRNLISHLKVYISNLNDLAYADALTSLRNKGAFDIYMQNIQTSIDNKEEETAFAICIFDCNNLKQINDNYGHDKGDLYLQCTAELICNVYEHSPVFRIGGDEFAIILTGADYENREKLRKLYYRRCDQNNKVKENPWEKVSAAFGMSVYDPDEDMSVNDVFRHADKLMYENKWGKKERT
ncbi:MAG: diguanylate cyclase [Erysipelotrichaceae bacterium]|nr:diguanylate cyclase [Erysipelotrichaceae bacterium]